MLNVPVFSAHKESLDDRKSGASSFTRRSCQTVLAAHLLSIVRVIAPILPHLAEELWQNLPFEYNIDNADVAKFVFESKWPEVNEKWLAFPEKDINFWGNILETAHTGKFIGSSLEAKVYLHSFDDSLAQRLRNMCEARLDADSLNRILITSQGTNFKIQNRVQILMAMCKRNCMYHIFLLETITMLNVPVFSAHKESLDDRKSGASSFTRRSCQTVLAAHLLSIVRVIAPILPHLAEELWQNLPFEYNIDNADVAKFVFESKWPEVNEKWLAFPEKDINFWGNILETAHTGKFIGSSLEAKVYLHSFDDSLAQRLRNMCEARLDADSLNRILITSQIYDQETENVTADVTAKDCLVNRSEFGLYLFRRAPHLECLCVAVTVQQDGYWMPLKSKTMYVLHQLLSFLVEQEMTFYVLLFFYVLASTNMSVALRYLKALGLYEKDFSNGVIVSCATDLISTFPSLATLLIKVIPQGTISASMFSLKGHAQSKYPTTFT
ncbi:tRNA synthetase class I (I, L, M and V) family protein [Artemisia annua]|uniref:tRNA synthetase class I (I, L, M and V) family protein n=1 Tax=Artemisia annua TaxID=35608 RepID=A0A2U1MGB2_ARTAN|nr:tRNA synthetase class I (I, L, M and V) family protein [Artemisia annua]